MAAITETVLFSSVVERTIQGAKVVQTACFQPCGWRRNKETGVSTLVAFKFVLPGYVKTEDVVSALRTTHSKKLYTIVLPKAGRSDTVRLTTQIRTEYMGSELANLIEGIDKDIDAEIENQQTNKAGSTTPKKAVKDMTVEELKAFLNNNGKAFPATAKKEELRTLAETV